MTSKQIIGKYQRSGFYDVGSTIELKDDESFEYNWWGGLNNGTTYGTWELEGDEITLNSTLQPVTDELETYEVIKVNSKFSDSLSIRVVDSKDRPMFSAICQLKADTIVIAGGYTNFKGEKKLPKWKADSLIIVHPGYYTIRYHLDTLMSRYEFRMEEKNIFYVYFTNDTWTYKKGRLYDPSIKKSKYIRKKYYQRLAEKN
ncbi:MAG: hypothetical protein COA33_012305 [Fluviicola sp.]|nr:hypothetical protein [Fluviicola sp.]